MKAVFLIGCGMLSLGGLLASPAIATDLSSTVATKPQVQTLAINSENKIKNSYKISQNSGFVNFETQLLKLTNLERQKRGLAPLKLSSQLSRSAQSHALDMATNNYFSHTGRNGSNIGDRAKANGYKYSWLGENIAAGLSTPEGTMKQWMNSAGHRANILNPKFTEIGFGYANMPNSRYQHYWVQVFGTPQR
jgi:uncharacterized protein YkwD